MTELEKSKTGFNHSDFGMRRRHRKLPWWPLTTVFVYSILGLAANWPVMPGNPSEMRQGDPTQVTWSLVWSSWSILHGHNPFFTDYVNFPRGMNLVQNTTPQLLGWITTPLTFFVNPISSLNLLQWLAFTLTASSMFFVVRRWTHWDGAAFVAGLVYGFSPYMVGQGLDHMVINFLPLPPLIFLCFYEILVRRVDNPIKWGVFLGAAVTAQFFIESEIAASCLLVVAVSILTAAVARPKQFIPALRFGSSGILLAAAIVVVCIAYPVWVMLAGPYRYNGEAHVGGLTADLASSILPTQMQRFAPPGWIAHGGTLVGGDYPENTSYLGIPLIIMMLIVVIRYWRLQWMRYFTLMFGATLVLSLGPRLEINNHFTSIPLPFSIVAKLPLMNNLLSVRITMYEFFFVALILAFGVDEMRNNLKRNPMPENLRLRPMASYLIVGILAVASLFSLLPRWPYPSYPAAVPSYFTSSDVNQIPQGSVVLISPYPSVAEVLGEQWQAMAHMRFKIIGGYGIFANANGEADTYPAKLEPTDVESYLWAKATGGTPFPDAKAPVVNAKLIGDVREFLQRYHVDAVLAISGDAFPQDISDMFSKALGPPSRVYSGLDAWYSVQKKLRSIHS